MKRFCLACSCVIPVLAQAQPVAGPYVSLGGGANIQQNEIVEASSYPRFPNNLNYKFDVGATGQVSLGYGLGNGLRAEIEGDFITNHVRGISGTERPARAGGFEQKYGGFVNVLYDVPLPLPVSPYLGVGAGGQIESLHKVNNSDYGAPVVPRPPGFQSLNGQTDSSGFAYQGIAGISFPLSFLPGLSLTAEYRFVGLLDPLPAFRRSFIRTVNTPNGDGGFTRSYVGFDANRHFENNYNHQILLGFRYALFQPAPPPPPSLPPGQQSAPDVQPSRTYLVFFDWDRADLTTRARQIVAQAAAASTHVQTTRIDVRGYTDLSGTAAYNQRLSVRRAQSVEAELVRDGVARGEISIHGYGESNPLVPTAKGVREPQNRRVEIILR